MYGTWTGAIPNRIILWVIRRFVKVEQDFCCHRKNCKYLHNVSHTFAWFFYLKKATNNDEFAGSLYLHTYTLLFRTRHFCIKTNAISKKCTGTYPPKNCIMRCPLAFSYGFVTSRLTVTAKKIDCVDFFLR